MDTMNEKLVSTPTAESITRNRYSLIGLDPDEAATAQILGIARHHCKLALEHGRTHTPTERRWEIIGEIQNLRSMREALIAEWRKAIKI